MARVRHNLWLPLASMFIMVSSLSACVSTEALYAKYDAGDCNLVAVQSDNGSVELLEQNSHTHFPWESAIYFEFDQSELTTAAQSSLRKSMQVLKRYPALRLGLQGFTDRLGEHEYNQKLAMQRVEQVRRFLVANGIAAERISLQPIGEVLPQISNNEETARAVNRRVELSLLEKDGKPMQLDVALNNS